MDRKSLAIVLALIVGCVALGMAQTKRSAPRLAAPALADVPMIRDSFTDNDRPLSSHTAEMGGTWRQAQFATNAQLVISGNRVAHDAPRPCISDPSQSCSYRTVYYSPTIPGRDGYDQMKVTRDGVDGSFYFYFRLATDGSESGYALKYDAARGAWVFVSVVTYDEAQCSTPLCNEYEEGAAYSDNFPIGQTRSLRIVPVGNVLTAYINGVKAIEVTDTDHPSAGYSGFALAGAGFSVDDFEAGTTAGGPSPAPTPSPTPTSTPTPWSSPSPSPSPTPAPVTTITCTIANKVLTCPLP